MCASTRLCPDADNTAVSGTSDVSTSLYDVSQSTTTLSHYRERKPVSDVLLYDALCCFLFIEFRTTFPATFSARFTIRLAANLTTRKQDNTSYTVLKVYLANVVVVIPVVELQHNL